MSWSLHIRNGDLNLGGPGGFATVNGSQKLIQDLKHWLLEPRGTDPFHPDYGSILDGGVSPDGSDTEAIIGGVASAEQLMAVESEIRRVLSAYQAQQADRLNRESVIYQGKNTFSSNEILISVDDVQVEQFSDVVLVRVTATTASGNAIQFTTPVR